MNKAPVVSPKHYNLFFSYSMHLIHVDMYHYVLHLKYQDKAAILFIYLYNLNL